MTTTNDDKGPLFQTGEIVATPGVMEAVTPEQLGTALHRHMSGDWGDADLEDAHANNMSLLDGSRLLSVYKAGETKFWIITEAEPREVTTFLLPEEY
jgi:hypothetical protein